jgi:hypothetical protein
LPSRMHCRRAVHFMPHDVSKVRNFSSFNIPCYLFCPNSANISHHWLHVESCAFLAYSYWLTYTIIHYNEVLIKNTRNF